MMPPTQAAEIKLLQEMIAGDALAFRALYEQYQGKIFLFAFRLIKSKSEAEEIVQEVFVKLWEKRQGIDTNKNFNAYILTITRNLILDRLKRAARDKTIQQKIFKNMEALQNASVNQLIQKELERLYQLAVNRLSPQKKKVYLLSREEELSYEEIALKLGISKNTVRNQISDSLKSIREFLSDHPDIACIVLAASKYIS
ncbi:MAG: RNA polymerase sigma-70 factor [Chitinophagaceae bacterium]|nr:RNA polymerase sigma-70 factor [Chitinophagaceae bacterium]MCW5914440.1 RNA polymerase sigma-70 factor [Chitinophagaceae bacterium]MCZ2395457.1 RNA polymerase sigma-70 factor [Chitinophagales bacterium]